MDREQVIETMRKAGEGGIHVLADFDHTLTRSMWDDKVSGSVISQLRHGGYLSDEYVEKSQALFEHYYPFETDASRPIAERRAAMQEWWRKHFELLYTYGLTRTVMEKVVAARTVRFRDGAKDFFELLHGNNIPLVIMSAGLGDMIELYLRQDNFLTSNVYIVSNRFQFEGDKVIGIHEPIIHSLNKHETLLSYQSFYSAIEQRKNVLLLGDTLDDVGMAEGFDYDNLVSFGFPKPTEFDLEPYRKTFDVVIENDGSLESVTNAIKKIVGSN